MINNLRNCLVLFACVATANLFAQGIITTPRAASPAASISQTIGISTVAVSYSRPSVKEREIWGKLVPYGWNVQNFGSRNEAPWRAGANENTVITFSHDAKIEGKSVPAGSYGLFLVINQDNSGELILSKDYQAWGSFWYDATNDQMRSKINVRDHTFTEMLTYEFTNITNNSTELVLNWEKKQFPVKIEFDVNNIVMANATKELTGPIGFTWQGYNSAANYSLQNDVNLEQGLKWAERASTANKNYTALQTKSDLLKKLGKTEDASKVSQEALTVATEFELNNRGYQLLNQKNYDDAIAVFTMNTDRHPESANAWDSLGEAYALKGDKKNAIKNFKKSLSLNPPQNVKDNSEKYLKQLAAM